MSDYYAAPNAELKDDAKSRSRIAHAFVAAVSCFVTLPILMIGVLIATTGELALFNPLRIFSVSLGLSLVAGLVILPFRTLPWYWAIPAGAMFVPLLIIIASIIDVLT